MVRSYAAPYCLGAPLDFWPFLTNYFKCPSISPELALKVGSIVSTLC